jgi:hypothetical protein
VNTPPLYSIGNSLIREAQAKKKSPRHLVAELFPFIFEASRTMSTREISDWLNKEHKVALSFVAISKALRESKTYWAEFSSEIEGAAGVIEEALGKKQEEFLFNEPLFVREVCEYQIASGGPHELDEDKSDFGQSVLLLHSKWFVLSAATRRECTPYLKEMWLSRDIANDPAWIKEPPADDSREEETFDKKSK